MRLLVHMERVAEFWHSSLGPYVTIPLLPDPHNMSDVTKGNYYVHAH